MRSSAELCADQRGINDRSDRALLLVGVSLVCKRAAISHDLFRHANIGNGVDATALSER